MKSIYKLKILDVHVGSSWDFDEKDIYEVFYSTKGKLLNALKADLINEYDFDSDEIEDVLEDIKSGNYYADDNIEIFVEKWKYYEKI
jgi:hypothetical protein